MAETMIDANNRKVAFRGRKEREAVPAVANTQVAGPKLGAVEPLPESVKPPAPKGLKGHDMHREAEKLRKRGVISDRQHKRLVGAL